jgi:hypothetical protein
MPEHKKTLKADDCPIIIKQRTEGIEDSVETGTGYEHPQAGDYLTQQHKNSQNSSMTTEMTASKHSCKVRFEVFTAVTMKNGVFWVVTPCGSCKNRYWYFFTVYVGC